MPSSPHVAWPPDPPCHPRCGALFALLLEAGAHGTPESRREDYGCLLEAARAAAPAPPSPDPGARRRRGRPRKAPFDPLTEIRPHGRPPLPFPTKSAALLTLGEFVRFVALLYAQFRWDPPRARGTYWQDFVLELPERERDATIERKATGSRGGGAASARPFWTNGYIRVLLELMKAEVQLLGEHAKNEVRRSADAPTRSDERALARELIRAVNGQPLDTTPFLLALAIEHRPPRHYAQPNTPAHYSKDQLRGRLLEQRKQLRKQDPLAGLELDAPDEARKIRDWLPTVATRDLLLAAASGPREHTKDRIRMRAICKQEVLRRFADLAEPGPVDPELRLYPDEGELWYPRARGEARIFYQWQKPASL